MIEITKTAKRIASKFFTKKEGIQIRYSAGIKFPKYFAGKTIKIVVEEVVGEETKQEEYVKRISSSGTGSILLLPSRFIDKKCVLIFEESDIIDWFKFRHDENSKP